MTKKKDTELRYPAKPPKFDITSIAPDDKGMQSTLRELRLAGLFDEGSMYDGMIGHAMLRLMKTFDDENHSGASASICRTLFAKLSAHKPLTPLTDDPSEWNDIGEFLGKQQWQSARDSEAFSEDGGKTYYLLSEAQAVVACVNCGSAYSGKAREKLADDEAPCYCGGKMVLKQPGDEKKRHASVKAMPVN